jgi:FKBP-type peptidyl-prolyl cis-trans isomerase FkpA
MKYNIKYILSLLCFLFMFEACSQSQETGFETSQNGLRFRFINKGEGLGPSEGSIITFHMTILNDKDSMISSTYTNGQAVKIPLPKASFKGSLEEGLAMMAEGDSAIFLVPVDSIFKGRMNTLPPSLVGVKDLQYRIKMIKFQTMEEAQAEKQKLIDEQMEKEKELIKIYMVEKGLEGSPTESGLYHIVVNPGSGDNPTVQNQVTVHYTGSLLDGSIFDSSVPGKIAGRTVSGEPVTFPLGGVIQGWQEGLAKMQKGEKALLIIPSHMGYGPQGTSGIPPYSTLVFEVDLIEFN